MVNVSKLSVIIIAKNEANSIASCIKSVQAINPHEVIVVDDNSSDETALIARSLGATVFIHPKNNFAEARNFGLHTARGEWVFYIDADEQASPELVVETKQVVNQTKIQYQAYRLRRVNYYLGVRWPTDEKIIRLFYKPNLDGWQGEVHESPRVTGKVSELSGALNHFTHRNLTEMVQNTLVWSEIEAKLRFDLHHPPISWWRLPRVMLPTFFDYYLRQGGWKIGTVGLIESLYQAFSIFITYSRLWEMQQLDKER